MTASDLKHRLAQAQRITALRERRFERARIEAVRAEREARENEAAAQARSDQAEIVRTDARRVFFAHAGEPVAEVWLIASSERAIHAASEQRIAADKRNVAETAAKTARRAHEQLCKRGAHLEAQLGALARTIMRIAQDREDEDMEERKR